MAENRRAGEVETDVGTYLKQSELLPVGLGVSLVESGILST